MATTIGATDHRANSADFECIAPKNTRQIGLFALGALFRKARVTANASASRYRMSAECASPFRLQENSHVQSFSPVRPCTHGLIEEVGNLAQHVKTNGAADRLTRNMQLPSTPTWKGFMSPRALPTSLYGFLPVKPSSA